MKEIWTRDQVSSKYPDKDINDLVEGGTIVPITVYDIVSDTSETYYMQPPQIEKRTKKRRGLTRRPFSEEKFTKLFKETLALRERLGELREKAEKEGLKTPADYQNRMEQLHRYNKIRDITTDLIEKLSFLKRCSTSSLFEEYGLASEDED